MTKRRFAAKPQTIQQDLRKVMTLMEATSLKVIQDILEGPVEIIFDRGGQRYVFRCEKYEDPLDNLRAAQLTISYLWRALEGYGVISEKHALEKAFAQFFLGFAATPDDTVLSLPSGQDEWWEILGVNADADKAIIANAYRSLAKVHHPDNGGKAKDFHRLRTAYTQGLQVQE